MTNPNEPGPSPAYPGSTPDDAPVHYPEPRRPLTGPNAVQRPTAPSASDAYPPSSAAYPAPSTPRPGDGSGARPHTVRVDARAGAHAPTPPAPPHGFGHANRAHVGAGFGGEAAAPPGAAGHERRPRARRLGLILGISIPLGVVLIASLIAALIVPGIVTDRSAQSAAATYREERAAWEAAYSSAALEPYAALDSATLTSALGSAVSTENAGLPTTAPDAAPLQATCDRVAQLTTEAASLESAAPPAEPSVDGGERNAAYREALAQWRNEQSRYTASMQLSATVRDELARLGELCALQLRVSEIQRTAADARASVYVPTLTLGNGGTERYDLSSTQWLTFTCQSDEGCPSFVDMNGRIATGNAIDATFVPWGNDLAAAYTELCPSSGFTQTCADHATLYSTAATDYAAVANVYRSENPVAVGQASPDAFNPNPALTAAYDTLVANYNANITLVNTSTPAETGAGTIDGAIQQAASTSISTIQAAVRAVTG